MTPTIGRIVTYHSNFAELPLCGEHPAIITRVHNNTTVNLQVFTDDVEGTAWRTSVRENDQGTNEWWEWPNIQHLAPGVAKRA